jgi:hypothetical protein
MLFCAPQTPGTPPDSPARNRSARLDTSYHDELMIIVTVSDIQNGA